MCLQQEKLLIDAILESMLWEGKHDSKEMGDKQITRASVPGFLAG